MNTIILYEDAETKTTADEASREKLPGWFDSSRHSMNNLVRTKRLHLTWRLRAFAESAGMMGWAGFSTED